MAKHYVLAMLYIMAQIMFNPAWAEVTSPTTVTSTTSQDAIQTFVKSDFCYSPCHVESMASQY